MPATVRFYESADRARDAATHLADLGFENVSLLTPSASPGEGSALVRAAVAAEMIPGSHQRLCISSLEQGRSIVAVAAPFGRGQKAIEVLEQFGPVDTDRIPVYSPRSAAPFSESLGIPVLAKFSPMTDLSIMTYTTGSRTLLSRNPTPLSSMLGLKTLTTSKGPWTSSFGMPLLSSNPAPLSSMIGWRPLVKTYLRKDTSFGFPLLSRNPAPLSSLFGLRVLSKRKQKRD